MDTCRFAASVSALKKNLDNHICWSNKDYYVHKLQQTCFCNINNLHKGLCNLRLSLGAASTGHFGAGEAELGAALSHFTGWRAHQSLLLHILSEWPTFFFFLLDLSLHFLKLMLSCFSNSYAYLHLRFHLPWFACSPWGSSLTVNLLAQITSWTYQTNPLIWVFFLPALFSATLCHFIEWLPWKCSPATASPLMEPPPMGQGMKSLIKRLEGEKKEKENKPSFLKTRSLNIFIPLFVLPLGEVRLRKMSCISTTSWRNSIQDNGTLLV